MVPGSDQPTTVRYVLSGFGGQGIQLVSLCLAQAGFQAGLQPVQFCVYSGAIRGGEIECFVVLTSEGMCSPVPGVADVGIIMSSEGVKLSLDRVVPEGGLVVNQTTVPEVEEYGRRVDYLRLDDLAREHFDDRRPATMLAAGFAVTRYGPVDAEQLVEGMRRTVPAHRSGLIEANAAAVRLGAKLADEVVVR